MNVDWRCSIRKPPPEERRAISIRSSVARPPKRTRIAHIGRLRAHLPAESEQALPVTRGNLRAPIPKAAQAPEKLRVHGIRIAAKDALRKRARPLEALKAQAVLQAGVVPMRAAAKKVAVRERQPRILRAIWAERKRPRRRNHPQGAAPRVAPALVVLHSSAATAANCKTRVALPPSAVPEQGTGGGWGHRFLKARHLLIVLALW
jgi:hypothetical protein